MLISGTKFEPMSNWANKGDSQYLYSLTNGMREALTFQTKCISEYSKLQGFYFTNRTLASVECDDTFSMQPNDVLLIFSHLQKGQFSIRLTEILGDPHVYKNFFLLLIAASITAFLF